MSSAEKRPSTPDAAAVRRRLKILLHVFTKALATPPESALAQFSKTSTADEKAKLESGFAEMFAKQREKLHTAGLWNDMEEGEHEFIQASIFETTMRQRIDASWLAESITCLLWSLACLEQIPAWDQESDIRSSSPLARDRLQDAIKHASLRPRAEIDRQRDLAELWHWRCRTHRLIATKKIPEVLPNGTPMSEIIRMAAEKAAEEGAFAKPIGGDFPVFGNAFREVSNDELTQLTSIASERHKALNWLCGYAPGNRWSETHTDT